jgi:hypothetical protein
MRGGEVKDEENEVKRKRGNTSGVKDEKVCMLNPLFLSQQRSGRPATARHLSD